MPDILPRRRALLASAAALPVLLSTASSRSSDVFTGPDPLAGPPRPAPDVITLQEVIASEEGMIRLYQTAIGGDRAATARARGLGTLLAEHEQHLARLRARLFVRQGALASPCASASAVPATRLATRGRLAPMDRATIAVAPTANALLSRFASHCR